jgi:hypothetical protein
MNQNPTRNYRGTHGSRGLRILLEWFYSLNIEDTITLIEVISALSTIRGEPLPAYVDPGAKLARAGVKYLKSKFSSIGNRGITGIEAASSIGKLVGRPLPSYVDPLVRLARLIDKRCTKKTNVVENTIDSQHAAAAISKLSGKPFNLKQEQMLRLFTLLYSNLYSKMKSKKSTNKALQEIQTVSKRRSKHNKLNDYKID